MIEELTKSVFIIAEACCNHLGNLDIAKKMVDESVRCGVNAIKFQHHLSDEEMLKDVPHSDNFNEPLYDILQKVNLSLDDHIELKKYCDYKNIMYLCTPFSLKAAYQINDLVSIFKIGSGEFTDLPSLKKIAKLNKPMILSTGMSTMDEIIMVYEELYPINDKLILMNCTSEYPPNYEDINLPFINVLKNRFNCIVGHSDHTPDIYTSIAAVVYGARIIEKHFILDKSIPGPDVDVSLDIKYLKRLVDGIRKVEAAMIPSEKKVYDKEVKIREWARRSIVSISDIKSGEKLTEDNIWSKRPGTGIPSFKMPNILGKTARVDIKKDTLINIEDCE